MGQLVDGVWRSRDGAVIVLPNLDRGPFLAAMAHAVGVVYPTRYEGFGLPAIEAMALGVPKMRVITTGGDNFEAEREQWDDGNNLVALEPGVVVAYERNTYTNTKLRKAGVQVL